MGRKMWFGTEERMRWIPVPQSGADSSPQGWTNNGTLLNGGGFVVNSFATHKKFAYSWSQASSREAAAVMSSYFQGTFGRGLLYFHEPTQYDRNILPAHWADPSMALDYEAPPLRRTPQAPAGSATNDYAVNDLPVRTATYDLTDVAHGFPGASDSLFIPVPPGFTLVMGAVYTATGTGGIFTAPVNTPGTASLYSPLDQVEPDAETLLPNHPIVGKLGVRLWVGKTAAGPASVTVTAIIARLIPNVKLASSTGYGMLPYGDGPYGGSMGAHPIFRGPWSGGQGHSGCRFAGTPTHITYSGVNGGQVGFAATFKEIGSWAR